MLTEREKEELFADFMLRYAEMSKEDRSVASGRNRSAMKDLKKYWDDQLSIPDGLWKMSDVPEDKRYLYRMYDGRPYFAADGIYGVYETIRKVIPFAVGCKRSLQGNDIAGSCVGYKRTYVLDPEKDREEALEIGKRLMDAFFDYLKAAKEGENK